ncbi:IS3 family transposase [Embleya scabrispora]|uniref:IS3 family transposase n=1 Tax=Embleya scabrispora TaxID=159449 RepID=UPI00037D4037|nr:IS3 family transposase [Embleya scabrispora]MYS82067.1 IS3 family transposase [Streptomyces sp. SID5474]
MSRFRFISEHRRFGVKRLCRVLGVARGSYYAWSAADPARQARAAADARLIERIRAVHTESKEAYGVPRITAELRADGHCRGAGIVGGGQHRAPVFGVLCGRVSPGRRLGSNVAGGEGAAGQRVPGEEEHSFAVVEGDAGRFGDRLPQPGEVLVNLPRREPPGHHAVEPAELHHWLDQRVQGLADSPATSLAQQYSANVPW